MSRDKRKRSPQQIGELLVADIEDTFSRAPERLTAPCRLAFVQGKIEMRQRMGRLIPDALWSLHDRLRKEVYASKQHA